MSLGMIVFLELEGEKYDGMDLLLFSLFTASKESRG